MRLIPLLLFAVLLACGCAARLPVTGAGSVTAGLPPPASPDVERLVTRTMLPVNELAPGHVTYVRAYEASGEREGGEAGEPELRNEVVASIGYTFERGNGGVTLGLEYGRWFSERWAVGPWVDLVFGDIDALAFGAGVWFRPIRCSKRLSVMFGIGGDLAREHEEHEEESEHEESERKWEAALLFRLGAQYIFEPIRTWRVGPAFYWDVIVPDKQAYVFALNIGKEF